MSSKTGYVSTLLFALTLLLGLPLTAEAQESGTYHIKVKATGKFLHEDGKKDKLVSTRWQPHDDFTRFVLFKQREGSFRIRVLANDRYLHEDGKRDKLISTRWQTEDDYSVFYLYPQPDGSYRIRTKATLRYWHVDSRGDKLVSTRYQPEDDYTRFILVPSSIQDPAAEGYVAPTAAYARIHNHSKANLYLLSEKSTESPPDYLELAPGDSGIITLEPAGKYFIYDRRGGPKVAEFNTEICEVYTFFYKSPTVNELRTGEHDYTVFY